MGAVQPVPATHADPDCHRDAGRSANLDAFADADGDQYRHADAYLDAFADADEYAPANRN